MIGPGPMVIRGMGPDESVTRQRIKPGTAKRIVPYTKPYRAHIALLLVVTALNAGIAVATPVLFKYIIDNGIAKGDTSLVVWISVAVAALALLGTGLGFVEAWYSGRISEGLIYDLRTRIFDHVQRQPLAFFTRAQTGALVSRLNTDVVGAQQAVTSLLSTVVSAGLTLVLVLAAMLYLSWIVTLVSLVIIPLFIIPGRVVGSRLQRIMREHMQVNAEVGSFMNERFNVTGALLAKLYGRPGSETGQFSRLARKGRDLGIMTSVYGKMLFLTMTLVGALATALVYGVGGGLVIDGTFQIGTLVALATLLTRLMGPINQLSGAQTAVLTALVSFDRLFEILDLKPLISEKPGAKPLPATTAEGTAPEVEFDGVSFRYPKASDVSLASLESIALPMPERTQNTWTLSDLSFTAPAGKLTALVGPSGAGKTTITHLVPRLYDPVEGAIRIGGHDLRDVTLKSLNETVGMVTQDAHLFHATIRDNLTYARPDATEQELIDACKAAQIWELIESLPDGFDTVVGDRGYRLSGGEKQRVAMARLLLKAPPIVVLDEATAHLDSESEAALQRALKTALKGRTSLVIAHRLSTIRDADQILVIDKGRVQERGTHEELLALDGLYAELYRTQFAHQPSANGNAPMPEPEPVGAPPGAVLNGGPGGPMPGGAPGGPGLFLFPAPPGGEGGPGPGGPGPRLLGGPPPGQD
ncbi:ABC transporter ATP-binding protein [Streptomyces sp. S.PNR 29]|uniref:ABC transporter ATP-binding protein n=1 Tax=Streptomyces sp. S.PNR 29 TaxID=2973805 RepID=UPI0025AFF963|nr:ABC transporter ATP-binding protein [Streptomyces sp. S.PNR 29]MDN0200191.1 ABC transporter ATP-binding protein/permease [Streptomyces sp. S.PNR 29]